MEVERSNNITSDLVRRKIDSYRQDHGKSYIRLGQVTILTTFGHIG
jgi:uncharacterized Zn finger protein